jgi:hypothetical protein
MDPIGLFNYNSYIFDKTYVKFYKCSNCVLLSINNTRELARLNSIYNRYCLVRKNLQIAIQLLNKHDYTIDIYTLAQIQFKDFMIDHFYVRRAAANPIDAWNEIEDVLTEGRLLLA